MSRVLPYPLLTASLIVMWMMLNAFSLGHFLLGAVVAILAGRAMAALQPSKPKLRRWQLIPFLIGIVLLDILRSNIAVASIILQGRRLGEIRSWRDTLRQPAGAAILPPQPNDRAPARWTAETFDTADHATPPSLLVVRIARDRSVPWRMTCPTT